MFVVRLLAFLATTLVLVACGNPFAGGWTGIVPSFADMARFGNAVYGRDGAVKALMRATDTSPLTVYVGASKSKAAGALQGPDKVLFEEKRSASGMTHRAVVFNDKAVQPSPYPYAFSLAGENYLLYSVTNDFELYKQNSENADSVVYKKSSLWDFSAISTYVQGIVYNGQNQAWIFCPTWSEARQTLYFTLAKWETNTTKGDFVRIRVYESKLIGTQFQSPTETQGEIDPYDASHYVDGLRHSENDFPSRMGIGWIGRLYVTADGKRAYFNALNNSFGETYSILKANDPWIFPTPNIQNFGTSGVTDVYDPRNIQTAVYQADIDTSGRFVNLKLLPPSVNRGGINFVSDISPDGSSLMVSHMETDDDFWAFGWGADGLALEVCNAGPEATEPWRGYISEYQLSGTAWVESNTIGKTIATAHSQPYLDAKAQFDAWGAASEAAFRSARPWIPATSTVAPTFLHGKFSYHIVDHPDMTFVNDSALVGTWNVVDFVQDQSTFVPGQKAFDGSLYFGPQIVFGSGPPSSTTATWEAPPATPGGSKLFWGTWTKGILWGGDMGAMEYTHLDKPTGHFLFIQCKSGDYSIRGDKPSYYVFQKQ